LGVVVSDLLSPPPLDRLVHALNEHDLEAMVACFADSYINSTPAHPARGFAGRDQVRRNWAHIFESVPDVRAGLVRTAVDGEVVWTEWEMTGTRFDSTPFLMRGVVIFQIGADAITAATFYLEPVEHHSGGADRAVQRVLADPPTPKEHS
jgi:predicted SnoaL-like aldol condensation-catalyzing enzyme